MRWSRLLLRKEQIEARALRGLISTEEWRFLRAFRKLDPGRRPLCSKHITFLEHLLTLADR